MPIKRIYLLLTGAQDTQFVRAKRLLRLLQRSGHQDHDQARIIITGRSALDQTVAVSEAQQYQDFLLAQQQDLPTMILEEQAMDTMGNMVFARPIISQLLAASTDPVHLYLITEHYHMARAKRLFDTIYADMVDRIICHPIATHTLGQERVLHWWYMLLAPLYAILLLPLRGIRRNRYTKDRLMKKLLQRENKKLQLKSYESYQSFVQQLPPYQVDYQPANTEPSIYDKMVRLWATYSK